MSHQAMTWAVAQRAGSPGHKAVLLALANRAGVENWSCFPSQDLLARETEQSVRTVQRQLADLERLRLIGRTHRYREGHRTSDLITLRYPQPNTPDWHVEVDSNMTFIGDTGGVAEPSPIEPEVLTSTDGFTTREAEAVDDFEVNDRQPPWTAAGMGRDEWLRMQAT